MDHVDSLRAFHKPIMLISVSTTSLLLIDPSSISSTMYEPYFACNILSNKNILVVAPSLVFVQVQHPQVQICGALHQQQGLVPNSICLSCWGCHCGSSREQRVGEVWHQIWLHQLCCCLCHWPLASTQGTYLPMLCMAFDKICQQVHHTLSLQSSANLILIASQQIIFLRRRDHPLIMQQILVDNQSISHGNVSSARSWTSLAWQTTTRGRRRRQARTSMWRKWRMAPAPSRPSSTQASSAPLPAPKSSLPSRCPLPATTVPRLMFL